MTKRAFHVVVFSVAFGFGLAGAYFIAPGLLSTVAYPPDAELEKRFADRRPAFTRLLNLFQEDHHLSSVKNGVAWVDFDTRAESSPGRLRSYDDLFKELGVSSIHRYARDGSIELRVWSSKSFFIGGKTKSYVYDPNYSGKVTPSLDDVYRSGIDANCFKSLDDNWYIYLDVW